MKKLYVIYDSSCGFCTRCRRWMRKQKQYLPVVFLPRGAADTRRLLPGVDEFTREDELTVVASDGQIWQGPDAFILCLWALRGYRHWAVRLSNPVLKPLARAAFGMLSEGRHLLTSIFGWQSDAELAAELRKEVEPGCASPIR